MKTYEPKWQVTLVKPTRRESLGSAGGGVNGPPVSPALARVGNLSVLDLTPFVSDKGGIHTVKSVRSPAGQFSLVLEDRPVLGDTLYGLIEPQDIIEIRFARQARGTLPLVMRGLVSSVSRSESIEGGQPSRLVQVSGQDFGKVLQQLRIYYLPGSVVGELWLDQYKFFRQFNAEAKQQPAGDFIAAVCRNIVDPYLSRMLDLVDNRGLQAPLPRSVTPVATIKGIVSPIGVASFSGGSVYDLLTQFLDVGPFNELYLEDRGDALALVCRPAPWRDLSGAFLDPDATAETVRLEDDALLSLQASRDDGGVANYFWCSAGRWELQNNGTLQLLALSTRADNYTTFDYVNTSAALYGMRKMEVESQLGDPLQLFGYGPEKSTAASEQRALANWLYRRREFLARSNQDNVVLESGSMRLRGDETLRPGSYLTVARGSAESSVYAVSVSHEFIPSQGFFTSVQFERGTGFVERQKRTESPWVAERNERGAYR